MTRIAAAPSGASATSQSVAPLDVAPLDVARLHHEPWYRYGVAVLAIEMAIAVAVGAYALHLAIHGLSGLP